MSDKSKPLFDRWFASSSDARHLLTFIEENNRHAMQGYIVCGFL